MATLQDETAISRIQNSINKLYKGLLLTESDRMGKHMNNLLVIKYSCSLISKCLTISVKRKRNFHIYVFYKKTNHLLGCFKFTPDLILKYIYKHLRIKFNIRIDKLYLLFGMENRKNKMTIERVKNQT